MPTEVAQRQEKRAVRATQRSPNQDHGRDRPVGQDHTPWRACVYGRSLRWTGGDGFRWCCRQIGFGAQGTRLGSWQRETLGLELEGWFHVLEELPREVESWGGDSIIKVARPLLVPGCGSPSVFASAQRCLLRSCAAKIDCIDWIAGRRAQISEISMLGRHRRTTAYQYPWTPHHDDGN